MKRYIVKGKDKKSLLIKVAKHFQVDPRYIKYEVVRQEPEFEMKVWIEKKEEEKDKIDDFDVEIDENGINLVVYKVDNKKALTLKRILKELEDRKIKDFDLGNVEKALYSLNTKIKIAEYDSEYYIDSEVEIEILNNMEATLLITKPKRGRETTVEHVLELCKEKGVEFGVRKKAVKTMIEEKIYDKRAILAKGKDPIHGVDARIIYTFEKDDESGENNGGPENKKVDFKKLNLIINVEKDEVIGKKIEAKEGEDGMDIFGKAIPARPPKDVTFSVGKNTYVSEDGLYLRSAIDGQIIMKGKILTVEPILNISGNVDYSTGNIDFVGSVIVQGNIVSGFEVKAEGDIIVEGLVEDCALISEGKIVVNNGILGNEEYKHQIYAREGIKAKFIQNMKVKTEGIVEVDKHILHSYVEAKNKIVVTSGQGIIIGGEVISQEGIEANIAGGKYETPTKLSIGIYGDILREESAINTEMIILEENKYKMEKIISELNNKKELLKDKFDEKMGECFKQLTAINNRYAVLEEKRDGIEEEKISIKTKKIVILQTGLIPEWVIRIGRELYLNRAQKIKTEFVLDSETHGDSGKIRGKMRKRIYFEKKGEMKYISNFDLARFLERLFKISGVSMEYTEGFSPRPKMSFGNPLSIGEEAHFEPFDVSIVGNDDNEKIKEKLNSKVPRGFKVLKVEDIDRKSVIVDDFGAIEYEIFFEDSTDKEVFVEL